MANNMDSIKNFSIDMSSLVQASETINNINLQIERIPETKKTTLEIVSNLSSIVSGITNIVMVVNGFNSSKKAKSLQESFESISEAISKLGGEIKSKIESVKKSISNSAESIGKNIAEGVAKGISIMVS